MESQPQNPEFSNNPENFHLCTHTFQVSSRLMPPSYFTSDLDK